MKKRQATEEQKAAAEMRRIQMREISRKIAAMSPEDRRAMASRMSAIATVGGRVLSDFNSCLIIFQRDGCTMVGGFRQWIKAGRVVRKGERGMSIWVPTGAKEENAGGDAPVDMAPGDVEVTGSRKRFVTGYVFDVTQTDEIGKKPAEGTALDDAVEVEATESGNQRAELMAPREDGWLNTQATIAPEHREGVALELELMD